MSCNLSKGGGIVSIEIDSLRGEQNQHAFSIEILNYLLLRDIRVIL